MWRQRARPNLGIAARNKGAASAASLDAAVAVVRGRRAGGGCGRISGNIRHSCEKAGGGKWKGVCVALWKRCLRGGTGGGAYRGGFCTGFRAPITCFHALSRRKPFDG